MQGLKPENWKWSWVGGLILFFLALNLLGPQGLLHYVLLKQRGERFHQEALELETEIAHIQEEIRLIENRPLIQARIVREKLGLLKDGEYRVDFIEDNER